MNLTLAQADKIRMDYGKFLELSQGRLMMLFGIYIPDILLPYSKTVIEEALEIVAAQFHAEGQKEAVSTIEGAKSFLMYYQDTSESIKYLRDVKWQEQVLPKMQANAVKQQEALLADVQSKY